MIECAFDRETGCACLKEKQCMLGKPCSFRKTSEQLIEGREKAAKRVASLPPKIQNHIQDKYYNHSGHKSDDESDAD